MERLWWTTSRRRLPAAIPRRRRMRTYLLRRNHTLSLLFCFNKFNENQAMELQSFGKVSLVCAFFVLTAG